MDSPSDVQTKEIDVPHCGKLKVFIQGDLSMHGRTVFLTCHDIGTNPKSWYRFIMHPSMTEVRLRSVFIHVCIPGQEDQAPDLPLEFHFPTMQDISEDLAAVLTTLNVKTVVAMGDGAGANIICRFAMGSPNRVMGVILINCTSTTAGIVEYFSNKRMGRKLSTTGHTQAVYSYLADHKFGGAPLESENVRQFIADLESRINPGNLARYFDAFLKRTDLSGTLADRLKTEALLVVGSKAQHMHTVRTMHAAMNKTGSSLLVVDNVGDVLSEAPQRLARALILFCKGCGLLSGVGIPGLEKQKTLSGSMEEADQPRRGSAH